MAICLLCLNKVRITGERYVLDAFSTSKEKSYNQNGTGTGSTIIPPVTDTSAFTAIVKCIDKLIYVPETKYPSVSTCTRDKVHEQLSLEELATRLHNLLW